MNFNPFLAEVCSDVFSVDLAVSFSDSLLLLLPFYDCCSECSDSLVYFSWDSTSESTLEFSFERPSRLTLGVGSLIGSIRNWFNGTFNSLLSLYSKRPRDILGQKVAMPCASHM